jgi:heme/copper-type cytochrome/quinol oxidase subunit 2
MHWLIWLVIIFVLVSLLFLWCALVSGSREDDKFSRDFIDNLFIVFVFTLIIIALAWALTPVHL